MKKLRIFFVFIAFASQVTAQNAPGLPDTFFGNTFGRSYKKVKANMDSQRLTPIQSNNKTNLSRCFA